MNPMTDAEKARREATKPRSFDLTDSEERARLLRETVGYARVSLERKDGTDLEGREWAYGALRNAVARGYTLVPPNGELDDVEKIEGVYYRADLEVDG